MGVFKARDFPSSEMRPKLSSRTVLPVAACSLPLRALDHREHKIIRCRYCGHKSRKTFAWTRSHTKFQCAGCGEEFSLDKKKIRKALDAVVKALDDLRRKLAKIVSPAPGRRESTDRRR
jgi:DNA-directed RNA polymerase subunit RPC12/RpoP